MKVLFVASGNSVNFEMAPFIKAQGESVKALGADVRYFSVKGRGLQGYAKAALKLKKYLKKNPVDIIHAHYTLSGWTAVLARPNVPIVLSLMGTDAYGEYIGVDKIKFSSRYLIFLTYLIQPFVQSIICKSSHIESFVYLKNKAHVIPNGILLDKINCHEQGFRQALGLARDKKHILFLGNKKEIRKNYKLAEAAVERINNDEVRLIAPFPVPHDQVVMYLNSVEVVVVPSLKEGSPNVVKEAMACNCPIVATDVGDVRWIIGNTPGCFVSSFDPGDVADKLKLALKFAQVHGKTNGRDQIVSLGLDSKTIALKILDVYNEILEKSE